MQERFSHLPKVVQDAITSTEVEKRLQELANTHKLHFDQWEKLENEVMLALLGFQPVENLQSNIKTEVGVTEEIAAALAADISKIVFEPIRAQMERELAQPVGNAGAASAAPAQTFAPTVLPATPPPPAPTTTVIRTPISEAYKPGEVSPVHISTEGDPYREQAA